MRREKTSTAATAGSRHDAEWCHSNHQYSLVLALNRRSVEGAKKRTAEMAARLVCLVR